MKEWKSKIVHEFERCETRKKCSKVSGSLQIKKKEWTGREGVRQGRATSGRDGKTGRKFRRRGNARLTAHIHSPFPVPFHSQSQSPLFPFVPLLHSFLCSTTARAFLFFLSLSFPPPLFLALCHSPLISTLFPLPLPDFFLPLFSFSPHSFRKIDEFQPHSHKPQAQRQKLKKLKRGGKFERSKREKEEIFERERKT